MILTDNSYLESLLIDWKSGEVVEENIEKELDDNITLLVPVKDCIKLESGGSSIQFIFVEKNEGVYILAFTSEIEMKKHMDGHKFIVLTFAETVALANSNEHIAGILLNPFTSNYRIPDKFTGKNGREQLMIGEPMIYPTEILGLLLPIFENNNIEKVWFTIMQHGYNDPQFLMILDGNFDKEFVYDSIRKIAIPRLEGVGMAIEKSEDLFGQKVANKYEPFWIKGIGINRKIFE